MRAFWRRKNRELALLRRFVEPSIAIADVADAGAYLAKQRELQAGIRRRVLAATDGFRETALPGGGAVDLPRGTGDYTYQRYDLCIDMPWLEALYGQAPVSGEAVTGAFYASGMSAIATIAAALRSLGVRSVESAPHCYFETRLLFERIFPDIDWVISAPRAAGTADVLWVDSIAVDSGAPPRGGKPPGLVVVDTTCFEPDSDFTHRWLSWSRDVGSPVILVRSHIKLDSFGTEFDRLGSAVLIARASARDDIGNLDLALRRARSGLGTVSLLPQIYPWLGDAEFLELAGLRTEGIRAFTRAVESALAARRISGAEVVRCQHGLFVLVATGLGSAGGGQEALTGNQRLARMISGRPPGAVTPLVHAASFGLDRVAANDFVSIDDGRHYLRIAGADWPVTAGAADEIAAVVMSSIGELAGSGSV